MPQLGERGVQGEGGEVARGVAAAQPRAQRAVNGRLHRGSGAPRNRLSNKVANVPVPPIGTALYRNLLTDSEHTSVVNRDHHGVRNAHRGSVSRERSGVSRLIRPRVIDRVKRRLLQDDDGTTRVGPDIGDSGLFGEGAGRKRDGGGLHASIFTPRAPRRNKGRAAPPCLEERPRPSLLRLVGLCA